MADPDRPGTDSARANSRQALIDAAFEEFSAKGYEAATVAGIAERAGVTTGALYAHFRGKLDLLAAAVGLTPVEDILRRAAEAGAQPLTVTSRLLGEGMARGPDRRTLLLLDVIVVARRDPRVAETLRAGLTTYLDAMERATEAGSVLGVIDPAVAPRDLARVLALLTFGMVVFGALGEAPPSDAAFERVAELLLQSAGALEADAPAALGRVRARAAEVDRAKASLDDAIVAAVEDGHSLRQVGAAAGLSHERVRQLLQSRAADRHPG